ncbi:MAG: carbon storage regulator [Thermoguttaceae bacterium]|nr:carbon storage regulator [Thermoguttaceae bacterium]
MLVLSRKKGESVVVNGNITIVVVDVRGDKARIGIEAPADVAVYRSEVLAKNAAANEENEENGATNVDKAPRKTKKVGETQKRGKSGSARGLKKALVGEGAEATVETLYLSKEAEAYRRADAPEAPESSERSGENVASAERSSDEAENKTV